jgi:Putative beta-barrel porin-2, OmpL-like. bbp2
MNFKLTTLGLSLAGIMGVQCLFSQTTASTGSVTTTATTPVATETEVKPPPLSITGQVDAYYRFSSAKAAGLTSYTEAINSFGLGMANVTIAKDAGKVGFVADLMFGPRAEATNYNYKTNSLAFLKQLYVYYKPTDKLKFTLGNFMTYVGYELVEASNNFNYSMSYNYTNGPFFHTGLKADITLSEHTGLMLGVFDQTDSKGTRGDKYFGAQFSYVNGGFKLYANGLVGNSPVLKDNVKISDTLNTTLDLTLSYQASEKLGLGLNVINKTIADGSGFTGLAAYGNVAASPTNIVALRGEYFIVKDGAKTFAVTLSDNIKVDAFTLIPEIRFDSSDVAIFGADKSDFAFILAAIYKF